MANKSDCSITKKDLSSEIRKLESRINTKFKGVDSKFEQFKEYFNERLDENLEQTKHIVLNSQDKILAEIQKLRDDNAAHRRSHVRINQEIEELQKKTGIYTQI